MSDRHTLLARMKGLIEARRDAAEASNELREELRLAENELVIRWEAFMKVAAEVLNDQQGEAATIPGAEDRESATGATGAATANEVQPEIRNNKRLAESTDSDSTVTDPSDATVKATMLDATVEAFTAGALPTDTHPTRMLTMSHLCSTVDATAQTTAPE